MLGRFFVFWPDPLGTYSKGSLLRSLRIFQGTLVTLGFIQVLIGLLLVIIGIMQVFIGFI